MYFRINLFLLLFGIAIPISADELKPYLHLQSVSYSEPIAIKSLLDEWQTSSKRGSKALTFNRAETGMQWGNWQLGVLERLDYQLEFSSETAELIYLTENRLPLEVGKEYELRIKVKHNFSRGLRVAYRHKPSDNFSVGVAASYLQGKAFTDGNIQGNATVTAEKDYDFQFDADYFYSRDMLFGRDVTSPRGHGYSLDLNLGWKPNNRFAAQLDIVDFVGKMFWLDAPFTTAVASSDNKTFDEEGYVRYQPAVSGLESNKNFTQRLSRKIFFASQYQWSKNVELLAELQDFGVARFVSLGSGWCSQRNDCFQAFYNTTAKALSFRYRGNGFQAELASDKLDIDQARYLALQLSFNQRF